MMNNEYYNAIVIKVVATTPHSIKYLTYADVLNGLTKPHLFIKSHANPDVEQIDYDTLMPDRYYIVVSLKSNDVWYWEDVIDVTEFM